MTQRHPNILLIQSDQHRFYDMSYADLVADPAGEIKNIYDYFQLPFTKEMECTIAAWLKEHPRNKHGKHAYSREQYGLTEEGIIEYFEDYVEQYADFLK